MVRGRRPGGVDTRGEILAAARTLFRGQGYQGTSLRAVAREAGVDPALVHHYFDGKKDLFSRAMMDDLGLDQLGDAEFVQVSIAAPRDQVGGTMVRAFAECWDRPGWPDRFAALQSAITRPEGAAPSGFISGPVARILEHLEVDELPLRSMLVGGVLTEMGTLRWTLRAAPVVALSADRLEALFGPVLQRFAVDPLD